LSPWRAVPLSVTKPLRRHQQEVHFHNTAVNAAEAKWRYQPIGEGGVEGHTNQRPGAVPFQHDPMQ